MVTPVSLGSSHNSTTTTASLTCSTAIQGGDLVVVFLGYDSASSSVVSSVSDGTNTYVKAIAIWNANWAEELWYCPNAKPVNNPTISVAAVGGESWNWLQMCAARAPGTGQWVLDQVGSEAGGGGTTQTASTGALTYSGELVFGSVLNLASGTTVTPSTGFTQIVDDYWSTNNTILDLEYQNVSGTGSVSYSPSWPNSIPIGQNAQIVAAFTPGPAWVLNSLGNVGPTSAASLSFTVPAGGIPAGALVLVSYGEQYPAQSQPQGYNWNNVGISDTRGNTWIPNKLVPSDNYECAMMAYSILSHALLSGDTITITTESSSNVAYASACWATFGGYSILFDAASYASVVGGDSASNPNFTGNAFTYPNELVVALYETDGCQAGGSASPDPNWNNTYLQCYTGGANVNNDPIVLGQTRINSGTGALTYNPSLSLVGVRGYSEQMFGFYAQPACFSRRRLSYLRRWR